MPVIGALVRTVSPAAVPAVAFILITAATILALHQAIKRTKSVRRVRHRIERVKFSSACSTSLQSTCLHSPVQRAVLSFLPVSPFGDSGAAGAVTFGKSVRRRRGLHPIERWIKERLSSRVPKLTKEDRVYKSPGDGCQRLFHSLAGRPFRRLDRCVRGTRLGEGFPSRYLRGHPTKVKQREIPSSRRRPPGTLGFRPLRRFVASA